MKYNPHRKALTVEITDLHAASNDLMASIHYIRKLNGMPLIGYSAEEKSTANIDDTAEYCILQAAKSLGIDLGVKRPGELDVRKYA
ncbi:hypothetical protein K0U83_00985 [bacterium]|nr:hypothetical protein [bacterium]